MMNDIKFEDITAETWEKVSDIFGGTVVETTLSIKFPVSLPHPLDRPHQLETAHKILNSSKQFVLVDAPVGSGKTSYAAFVSQYLKTLALVETKSLQAQYNSEYSFVSLPGKNAFNCNNYYDRFPAPESAELCLYDGEIDYCSNGCDAPVDGFDESGSTCKHERLKSVTECARSCPYPIAKREALASPRMVTSYTKFLLDFSLRDYANVEMPDVVFLDEAHKLDNVLTDFYSIPIDMPDGVSLPTIKTIVINGKQTFLPPATNISACLAKMGEVVEALENEEPDKEKQTAHWVKWDRKVRKLTELIDRVEEKKDTAFFEVTGDKLILKFLNPDMQIFRQYNKVVMMTATPSGWESMMTNLGINPAEVDHIEVPSAFSHSDRAVMVFEQGPRVRAKDYFDKSDAFLLQVKIIKKIMESYPTWTGIAHLSSYYQCEAIHDELYNQEIDWATTMKRGIPTDAQLTWWQEQKKDWGKRLLLSPTSSEGVSLPDENINLICKMSYPPAFVDGTFLKAKRLNNQKAFNLQIARTVEQQRGRTQRGIAAHYGPKNSFIAILDNNYKRFMKQFSEDFIECLTVFEQGDK